MYVSFKGIEQDLAKVTSGIREHKQREGRGLTPEEKLIIKGFASVLAVMGR